MSQLRCVLCQVPVGKQGGITKMPLVELDGNMETGQGESQCTGTVLDLTLT